MCVRYLKVLLLLHIQHLHDYALDFQEFVYLTYHRQYTLPCEHGHLILLLPLRFAPLPPGVVKMYF